MLNNLIKIPGAKAKYRLKINKFNDLPENAKKYIQILEDLMETNISIVSTGPDRKETIDINGTLSNI